MTSRDVAEHGAGGGAIYVQKLAEHLAKEHEVCIVSMGGTRPIFEVNGVRIMRQRYSSSDPLSRLSLLFNRELRNSDLVIESSDGGGPWFTLGGTRRVLLAHQLWQEIFRYELGEPLGMVVSALEPHFYEFYRKIPTVANSDSTAESLKRLGIENVTVIPPGLDESFLEATRVKLPKWKQPTLVVLCRLRAYKGIPWVLKCFEKILEKYPDARLRIVGDGPEMRRLQALALSLGVQSSVDFLGKVDEKTKLSELSHAHVLVNASIREGFGLNVLEAGSCYTPCVGWNVLGTRDVVNDGENGVLVEPFSESSMFDAIIDLLSNRPKMLNMGRKAREWSEHFTWTNTCKRFDEFLHNVQ